MDDRALWDLICAAHRGIFPFFDPLFGRYAAEHGLTPRGLGLLLAAPTFEPETLSPARLRVRNPYSAAEAYQQELEAVARAGFFSESPEGEFSLTVTGRLGVLDLIAAGRLLMAKADPLPPADSARLAALTGCLVHAALDTPMLGENWSIGLSYRLMPETEPPLPYFEQAVSCLYAYRDDAHLAAWKPSGLDAPAIETLTLLWRGEADSLAVVYEKLKRRGHPSEVYTQALNRLRARGLVSGQDASLQMTGQGKSLREIIEQDTDHYFYAPWLCLAKAEKAELAGLSTRLRDGLQP